jgi:hypothetical protein
VWFTGQERPHLPSAAGPVVLPVGEAWLAALEIGDRIKLFDARDARRELTVTARNEGGVWAECDQTAYVMPGTSLVRETRSSEGTRRTHVADIPPTAQTLTLAPGDTLVLTREPTPGRPAVRNDEGVLLQPATIGVTLPEVFHDVRAGESIWFDDGRIGGVIHSVAPDRITVDRPAARRGRNRHCRLLVRSDRRRRPRTAGATCRSWPPEPRADPQDRDPARVREPAGAAPGRDREPSSGGIPSRAEITDAAMGERAECVMLNKGPHIVAAVRALDNILTRMQAHQRKKTAMLRHLVVADRFFHAS